MSKKKVIIIGGGISGITAGIYAQQNGFQSEIYEKHMVPGGECTGWNRKGYHIDNCIHWLTGSVKGSGMYQIWENIGAVGDEIKMIHEPCFYRFSMEGKTIHFWTDLEKARKEFLVIAPEDAEEINKLFDYVKAAESLVIPAEMSVADMNLFQYMKMGSQMADMAKVMKEYGKSDVNDLAGRFHSSIIREAIRNYMIGSYPAYTFVSTYAFLSSGNGIPEGGSKKMSARIAERYKELGGKLLLGKEVKEIKLNGKLAEGIVLADGTEETADYIICTADTHITFSKLLDAKYMDKKLRKMYENKTDYRVSSLFHAAFGVKEDVQIPSGASIFACEPFQTGTKRNSFMGIRNFNYDATMWPEGKQVIQCSIHQDENDYDWWLALYQDKDKFNHYNQQLADTIEQAIIREYPELSGKIELLDTWTPITYSRFCGAYKGSYMSFVAAKGAQSYYIKNRIPHLKNVVLAGQWLQPMGGLPAAATSGKFAVQALLR